MCVQMMRCGSRLLHRPCAAAAARVLARRRFNSCATPPASLAAGVAQHLAAPAVIEHVRRYGFAVIDNAFSRSGATTSAATQLTAVDGVVRSPPNTSPLSARLRAEVLQLAERGVLHANHTHLVSGVGTAAARSFVAKQSILESDFASRAELLDPAESPLSADSCHFWRELVTSPLPVEALNSALGHSCVIDTMTIKAQLNEGNSGCFPLHFDTDARLDPRKLTAILYANPEWSSLSGAAPAGGALTDGGELRLYPLPHRAIDISPVDDRLVLFDSARMLHRVLPSARPRVCVSIWFWQNQAQWQQQRQQQASKRRSDEFTAEQMCVLEQLWPGPEAAGRRAALSHLLSEGLRPHWSKLALGNEWFTSIEQSHADSEQRQVMLVKHLDEMDQIERALTPLLQQITPQHLQAEHLEQGWRDVLPLPWVETPVLPPFCRFVGQPAPTEQAPTHAHEQAVGRLVDWLG